MRLRYREIHRTEIQRLLKKKIEHSFGGLITSHIFMIYCWLIVIEIIKEYFIDNKAKDLAGFFIFVFFALSFSLVYFLSIHMFRKMKYIYEWYDCFDYAVLTLIVTSGFLLRRINDFSFYISFILFFLYAKHKAKKYTAPYVKRWFYIIAKGYFQKLKKDKAL